MKQRQADTVVRRRRLCGAAALAAGLVAAGPGARAQTPLSAQAPPWGRSRFELTPELHALLADGEALLRAGDTAAAEQRFDRVAQFAHDADNEIALVRTYMQAGGYRRALAFAAHAAGAHRAQPAARALYAWLLMLGAQQAFATRMLDEADPLAPGDPTLAAARAALSAPWPQPSGALLDLPARAAPYATGARPAAGATAAGSATLVAGGRLAIAPAALAGESSGLWLRNGLGRTVAARRLRADTGLGVVVLEPESALAWPADLRASPTAPYAGSPGALVEYAPGADAQATWPLLRAGFLGRQLRAGGRTLGISAPKGPRGGPVFDADGRLAGLALTADDGVERLLGADQWSALFDAPPLAPAESRPSTRQALESVYETGLLVSLQLLVLR